VSVAEARERLRTVFVEPLHKPLRLIAHDATLSATPWELGVRVDVDDVLRRTYEAQERVPTHKRLWRRALGDRRDITIGSIVDTDVLRRSIDAAADQIDRPVRDASLEVTEDGKLEIVGDLVGREVDRRAAAASVVAALRRGSSRVQLPVKLTQPELKADAFKNVILVHTATNTLDLYVDGKVEKHYSVATGTGGYPTPRGLFRIVGKKKWPGWSNPHQPWSEGMPEYIPPGRWNPLGTRALYLSVGGIRIHGTPKSYSIGRNASHGCIRMHISQSEELFELVDVGTPVKIVY
jgi:lipoprotein-anchoring transpeptidase ErfK/SrfK